MTDPRIITARDIRDGVVTTIKIEQVEVSPSEQSVDEMLAWILAMYEGCNVSLTATIDRRWTCMVERASGRWEVTISDSPSEAIESMITKLKDKDQ